MNNAIPRWKFKSDELLSLTVTCVFPLHSENPINAFRDGEIKTSGTDIDKLMPPVLRFGGGNRAKKKQGVIEKLKSFFERFFGIGG